MILVIMNMDRLNRPLCWLVVLHATSSFKLIIYFVRSSKMELHIVKTRKLETQKLACLNFRTETQCHYAQFMRVILILTLQD